MRPNLNSPSLLRIGFPALLLLVACNQTPGSQGSTSSASTATQKHLGISLSGTGSGKVTSAAPAGVNIGYPAINSGAASSGVCGTTFDAASVVALTATPVTTSLPTWFGCTPATPNALTCTVTLPVAADSSNTFVRVSFDIPGQVLGMANQIQSSIAASPASVLADGTNTSAISVTVRDVSNAPLPGKTVAFSSAPGGTLSAATATTDVNGVATVTIKDSTVEADTVTASVETVTLPPTTVTFTATNTITGNVVAMNGTTGVDSNVAGATVRSIVNGVVSANGVQTNLSGSFSLLIPPGAKVFIRVDPPSSGFGSAGLTAETRIAAGAGAMPAPIELSMPPTTGATYSGTEACISCHPTEYNKLHNTSALSRSLALVQRNADGSAMPSQFTAMVNKILKTPRHVMNPTGITGTIAVDLNATPNTTVTGTGTLFTTQIVAGDKIVYQPNGLGQYIVGTVTVITDDTHLTLSAVLPLKVALQPQTVSITGAVFSVDRLSRSYANEMPMDSNDIVAPNWPGVKATSPNSDPLLANGGAQVQVYFCNLKGGTFSINGAPVTFANDEYVQKFGGSSFTCTDGSFYTPVTNATPTAPMVRTQVIYGGQGDTLGDGTQGTKPNMGVFKQRYQGKMADVKYAVEKWGPGVDANSYTAQADFDRDSLTLPIQLLHSGDLQGGDSWLNGGYKLNGYHPTEQKFPGESWSNRTRTFSHACAGCHNTGLQLDFNVVTQALPFSRDDGTTSEIVAAVKTYSWANNSSTENFNVGCEHCHGPGSQHVAFSTSTTNGGSIVNPKYLTADKERQSCGKCHAYDDAADGRVKIGATFVEQTYGFEAPFNTEGMTGLGGGNFVPGVHDLFDLAPGKDFIGNWSSRLTDPEANWNPEFTPMNKYSNIEGTKVILGQAHRQQYAMLQYSKHANNNSEQITCSSCHDSHSTFLGNPKATELVTNASWQFASADFRNNVLCLSCHAGSGDFASVTKQDVANVHLGAGGTVTKDGIAVTPSSATLNVASAVTAHMSSRAGMILKAPNVYNPTADTTVAGNTAGATYVVNAAKIVTNGPVGRCTSCHMPKVAKSGGYFNDVDVNGLLALVESDQASHTFDIIMPSTTPPLGSGGPTFQSGSYNYKAMNLPGGLTPSNPAYVATAAKVGKRYDYYGYMPNSCSKCHLGARKASLVVPDVSGLYPTGPGGAGITNNARNVPSFWPLTEHLYDVSGLATDPSPLKTCFQGATPVFCNMIKSSSTLVPATLLPVP